MTSKFRRLKSTFDSVIFGATIVKWTDVILIDSSAHGGMVVKLGDPISETKYTNYYPDIDELTYIENVLTEPLSLKEVRKLRHHMTKRIWMYDGVFECVEWDKIRDKDLGKRKLLPPYICHNCMLEGNKYTRKQIRSVMNGKCLCCQKENIPLIPTRMGWPIDLTHKGFCFTVITTGSNYTNNIEYYNHNFDMTIYSDYKG